MKKYLLMSFTALFIAATLCADPTIEEPKINVEADATLTWGVDLGAGKKGETKHGFKNEASWKVTFPFVKKGSYKSRSSEADVYGEIELKDIQLSLKSENKKDKEKFGLNGSVDSIKGRVVFYGAYMTVYNKPDFRTNYAKLWAPIEKSRLYDFTVGDQFKLDPGFDGFGTKIGYASKELMDLDVGIKLGSNGNWESEDDVHSKYGVGFDFHMKPLEDLLAVDFNVNSTLVEAGKYKNKVTKGYDEKSFALGLGTKLVSKPFDGLKLTFGFDGAGTKFGSTKTFAWDLLFNASFNWISSGVYVASAGAPFEGTVAGKKSTDMGVYVKFEIDSSDDKMTKKKKPSFLVDGLDAGVYLAAYRLLSERKANTQVPMLGKVWGSYEIALGDSFTVKPFSDFWLESNHKKGLNGAALSVPYFGMAYDVGVECSPFEKVTFTATWAHGKIEENHYALGTSKDNKPVIETPLNYANHNGTLTIACKVVY